MTERRHDWRRLIPRTHRLAAAGAVLAAALLGAMALAPGSTQA